MSAELDACRAEAFAARAARDAALSEAARSEQHRAVRSSSDAAAVSRLSADVEALRTALLAENTALRAGAAAAAQAAAETRAQLVAAQAQASEAKRASAAARLRIVDLEERGEADAAELAALRRAVKALTAKGSEAEAELRVLRAVQVSLRKGVELLQQRSKQLGGGGSPQGALLAHSPIVAARAPSPRK